MKQSPGYRKITIWTIAAIVIAGFLLYGASLRNSYNIDDDYVCENHELVKQGIKGIPEIFTSRYNNSGGVTFGYRPVTIALYAIEYQFFGESTAVGHFFNVIYYIIVCIILFFFLRKLLETKFASSCLLISTLATAIFMTHAIHTEVVLSLKNREEILCMIFCLSSAILALRYYDKRKIIDIIFAIILLLLGFLTKESAIVFLAIIPLAIIFFRTDFKLEINVRILKDFWQKVASYFKDNTFIATFGCIVLALLTARVIINWKLEITPSLLKGAVIRSIYFVFLLSYIIIILVKRRNVTLCKRNIILWSVALSMTILRFWNYWALIAATIILLLAIAEKKATNETKEKVDKAWKKLKLILPFALIFIIAAAAIAIAHYIPESALPKSNTVMSKWQNPIFAEESAGNRFAIAMYSLIYYLKLLFVPYPLRYYYGYNLIPDVGLDNPIAIISIIVYTSLIITAIWLFNRRNLISFGILFYLISIFPFSNLFFPFTGIIGERMLFAPSIGFALAVGYIIIMISKAENGITKGNRFAICIMAAIVIIPNTIIAINRNSDWKDRETLYAHDIEYSAESAKANVLYANLLSRNAYEKIANSTPEIQNRNLKDIERSEKLYRQALEIDSTYGNAWYNLAYLKQIVYQDYDNAEIMFEKALAYDSSLNNSYYFLGMAKFKKGKYTEAIENLEKYSQAKIYGDKFNDLTYFFIGKSYYELKNTAKAKEYYQLCIDSLKDENFKHTIADLKQFIDTTYDYALGIRLGKQEVKHFPDKDLPYVDLGNFYMLSGDTVNAIANWEIAYDKYKGNKNIAATLYNYFISKGNKEKAEYYLKEYNAR